MAGFASYNQFRQQIDSTQSTLSPTGLNYLGVGIPFSDASWSRGNQMTGVYGSYMQGNTPAEYYELVSPSSFTSTRPTSNLKASRFFYNISPGIQNAGTPDSGWVNSRNAIGLNFGGRGSLAWGVIDGNACLIPTPTNNNPTPNGTISGVNAPGGNTGGGVTTGGNTGGVTTGGNTGGGNTGGIGVAVNTNNQITYSDVRLKENLNKVGISESGIPLYEFNYKGSTDRYRGTTAQDLIKLGKSKSINKDNNGFYMVNYNTIDVEFTKI